MLKTALPVKRIIFFVTIVLLLSAALSRISRESLLPGPKVVISEGVLYQYWLSEGKPGSLEGYQKNLKAAGVDVVCAEPEALSLFVQAGMVRITDYKQGSAFLEMSFPIWENNFLSRFHKQVNVNGGTVHAVIEAPLNDLLRSSFQVLSYGSGVRPDLLLISDHKKETIDGWLADNRQIIYGKDEIAALLKEASGRTLVPAFEPYNDLHSPNEAILQFKRAYLERKDRFLIIPWFENLAGQQFVGQRFAGQRFAEQQIVEQQIVEQRSARPRFAEQQLVLVEFVKEIKRVLRFPGPFFWLAVPRTLFAFPVLILLLSLLFFKKKLPALAFVIPSLLIFVLPVIRDLYILVICLLTVWKSMECLSGSEGPSVFRFLRALAWLALGSLAVSYLGSEQGLLEKVRQIRFVKPVIILSFLTAAMAVWRRNGQPNLEKPLDFREILIAGFAAAVVLFFLWRSGTSGAILPFEQNFRDAMDRFLPVRPRLKEIFFFWPLLLLTFSLNNRKILSRRTAFILFTVSSGAFISVLNTFMHTQTFFLISFVRCLTGLIPGLLAGWVLILLVGPLSRVFRRLFIRN